MDPPVASVWTNYRQKVYQQKQHSISDMAFIIVPAMYKHYTLKHYKWTPPLNGHWNLG